MNPELFEKISKVERLAKGSKISRFLYQPANYIFAQVYRHIVHRFSKKGYRLTTKTFWNENFTVELPAATDIFLTGGKSDESEIRLAKFMIRTLKPGDQFLDVGSHFGYYSRLALKLIGPNGLVISLEPSESTFKILQLNLKDSPNAICLKAMAGEKPGLNQFYQFPTLYSEYNTAHPEQFSNSEWFKKSGHNAYQVITTTLDEIVFDRKLSPTFIKIDTEGSELEVIKGALHTLSHFRGMKLAMEFLSNARSNQSHIIAAKILEENGFHSFAILEDGTLKRCTHIESHLSEKNLDSDNIIFLKMDRLIL